jgi:hypothetical protein
MLTPQNRMLRPAHQLNGQAPLLSGCDRNEHIGSGNEEWPDAIASRPKSSGRNSALHRQAWRAGQRLLRSGTIRLPPDLSHITSGPRYICVSPVQTYPRCLSHDGELQLPAEPQFGAPARVVEQRPLRVSPCVLAQEVQPRRQLDGERLRNLGLTLATHASY